MPIAPRSSEGDRLDEPTDPEAGIDALEHLAYLIADEMVAELNLQTGDEMLGVLKKAEPVERAEVAQPPKLKARAAGGK